MVLDEHEAAQADLVFSALGDPTRRDILRRTAAQASSVSALARHYAMSLTAVQKHVSVLERAQLVTKSRSGREQLVRADLTTVRDARRQLEDLESLWRGRLDRIDDLLAEQADPAAPPPGQESRP